MTALPFFRALQAAMDNHAADVWDMVNYSRSPGYRLRLGEVTLTELGFFRLHRFWTQGVYIRTNEPDETRTGADWEWIIGHNDEWVQIRVQAKILSRKPASFVELSHGPAGSPRQQMDTLIAPPPGDVLCRWMPIYVFYASAPPAQTWSPPSGVLTRQHGCSAKLAHQVRNTYGPHGSRATLLANKHLPDSIRWAQVFDGLIARLSKGESMSAIIHSLAGQSFDPTAKHIKDFWNPKVTAGSCNKTLPGYLQAVLDRRDDDGDNAPLAQADVQVPTPSKPSTPEESAHSDQREEPTQAEADAQQPSGDDLPIRVITLDAADAKFASESLPKFVAVIDIDRLPHIDEPLPATNPQLGRTSEPSSTAPSSSN